MTRTPTQLLIRSWKKTPFTKKILVHILGPAPTAEESETESEATEPDVELKVICTIENAPLAMHARSFQIAVIEKRFTKRFTNLEKTAVELLKGQSKHRRRRPKVRTPSPSPSTSPSKSRSRGARERNLDPALDPGLAPGLIQIIAATLTASRDPLCLLLFFVL